MVIWRFNEKQSKEYVIPILVSLFLGLSLVLFFFGLIFGGFVMLVSTGLIFVGAKARLKEKGYLEITSMNGDDCFPKSLDDDITNSYLNGVGGITSLYPENRIFDDDDKDISE